MSGGVTAGRLTLGKIAARGRERAQDPAASKWFKQSLWTAFSRDPVDAANDAEALAEFLSWRVAAMSKAITPARRSPLTGKEICKRLGVTAAGLSVLAIAIGDPHGRAIGPAFGVATHGPRVELRRDGMLREMDFGPDVITQAGRVVITEARNLGW